MTNSNDCRRSGWWMAALCALGLAAPVLAAEQPAQENPPAPAETGTARGAGGLQEVVVTATRREEALSRVPISVTALTQEALDQKGIKDFRDVVRFTPGVTIDDSGTNAVSIRGISSSGGAGTTGIYIDDTPIQMRSVGFNPDDTLPKTFDLQRVEVLRGPQGTLFGAGAEGGAVRYIMTPASTTAADMYVRSDLSYTQYGQPNAEFGIAAGHPVVDGVFGVRGSIWYRYDGGWINRVDPGTGATINHNINYSHSYMARLAATWQPSASVTVTPSILYQKQDKHDEATLWPTYSNLAQGQFNTATPERIGGPDTYYLPALRVDWNLAKSQLIGDVSYFNRRQLTAYQGTVFDLSYWNTIPSALGGPNEFALPPKCTVPDDATSCSWFPLINATGIHLPAALRGSQTPNIMTNTQRSYTAELRWQSANASSRWTWTAGVFWQQAKEGSIEELKSTNIAQVFNYLYGLAPSDFYSADGVTPASFYSCPTNAAYPVIPACDIYYNNNNTIDRQIAGFGEVSYGFTDRLRLTVGERIAHTTFSLEHYADGFENYGPGPASASQSETPNTPKAVLSFQADPRNLYYLTYAKGYRVGGGNAPLPPYCDAGLVTVGYPNGAPLTYKSDYTQSGEVGAKNAVGGWLRLASSVYYIQWHNIQQNLYVAAGGCGLQFTDNLATAVAKGFDLQADMAFGPLTIDLATGYTSARYTKNSPANCTPGSSGLGIPCLAVTGDAVTGQEGINYAPGTTPPWTVAVGAQYDFKLATREAFVRADWQYESRSSWLAAVQDPAAGAQYFYGYSYPYPTNSYTSLRAGINFGAVQLTAFGDNLLDSHTTTNYILGQTDGTFTPQQNTNTFHPRTFGLNLIWHGR